MRIQTIPESDSEALLVRVIIDQMWSQCFFFLLLYSVIVFIYYYSIYFLVTFAFLYFQFSFQ